MASSTTIGANNVCFPIELWGNVFRKAATVHDALNWADAFCIQPRDEDWSELVEERCPAMLAVLPKPTLRSLLPGTSLYAESEQDRFVNLDTTLQRLFEPLMLDVVAQGESARPMYQPILDATAFMMQFTPDGPYAHALLDGASTAWSHINADEENSEASYYANAISNSLSDAWVNQSDVISLCMGPGAHFPNFWTGLTPVHTVNLFGLDTSFELDTLCTWPLLRSVRVEPGLTHEVRLWLEQALRMQRPDIRVETIDQWVAPPALPIRHNSDAYFAQLQLNRAFILEQSVSW